MRRVRIMTKYASTKKTLKKERAQTATDYSNVYVTKELAERYNRGNWLLRYGYWKKTTGRENRKENSVRWINCRLN